MLEIPCDFQQMLMIFLPHFQDISNLMHNVVMKLSKRLEEPETIPNVFVAASQIY